MTINGKRTARWLSGLVLLLLLVLGGRWVSGAFVAQDGSNRAEVQRGDLVLTVEVTGTLQATESSLLGPPQLSDYWQFKIAHMAPEGEQVEEGTPVLGFDTAELQQRLQTQMAEVDEAEKQIEKTEKNLALQEHHDRIRLAEAEARLRKAQLKLEGPSELIASGELELARLDRELARKEVSYLTVRLAAFSRSAEAQLAALRNQYERAQTKVAEIQDALERMTRKAPRAGTVIYATNWRDEKKKVGDSCWRGESVMELPDLTQMEAEGRVDEADMGRLDPDQRVILRLDAHPDIKFEGRIKSIWRTVQRESWRSPAKIARLAIELEQTDTQRMRPGMRFRGRVETDKISDVLLIPIEAVFPTPEGPIVYAETWNGYRRVSVELGRRNEGQVELLGGLQEGETISLVEPRGKSRS